MFLGLRVLIGLFGFALTLFVVGCQQVAEPVTYQPPAFVSGDGGEAVRLMRQHLGVCPFVSPARAVRGLLVSWDGSSSFLAEIGLGVGSLPRDVEFVVVFMEGDRKAARSIAWLPDVDSIMTGAGAVGLPGKLVSRLTNELNCAGRRPLASDAKRHLEDVCLALKVMYGEVEVLPIVLDGRGLSRSLAGAIAQSMFGGHCVLLGLLTEDMSTGTVDWRSRLGSVVKDGWKGQRVSVPAMAVLELSRQFGFSPFELTGRESNALRAAGQGGERRKLEVLAMLETRDSLGVMEYGRSRPHIEAREVLREISKVRGVVEVQYEDTMLNAAEEKILLDVVRMVLVRTAEGKPLQTSEIPQYSSRFAGNSGCSVTLWHDGKAYATVSSLGGKEPLLRLLLKQCGGLMTNKSKPVTLELLNDCVIEVGVISEPKTLEYGSIEELKARIVPGRHGVVLKGGGKAAGFMPQVWAEYKDVESFLRGLCRRAGIEERVLLDKSTVFQVFEVQTMRENRKVGTSSAIKSKK